jgi:MFS family permease
VSESEPRSAAEGLVPLRRNRTFQLLWAGGAVSQLGTELTRLAMPLLVLASTGSPAAAGLVAGANVAATVLTQLPAGVWVDRWDRRRTLVVAAALRTVNAAGLAVLVAAGQPEVWQLAVFAAADGVGAAFTEPVVFASIRAVVPAAQLPTAYAQQESRSHAARLLGPPLGGLLYGFADAVPFVADAVTFLVAAVCAAAARVPRCPAGTQRAERRAMHRELGEALGWVWRQRGLRSVCAVFTVLNPLGGAFLLPLIVLVGERGADAVETGTVLAGAGVGGLAGALLSGRISQLLPPGKLVIAIIAVFGCAVAAAALPLGPWWPMVPLAVVSLATPSINVVVNVVLARLTPESMLGRVDAVLGTAAQGLRPVGPVLGGGLAALLGGAGSLVLLGALLLLTAGLAAAGPVRRFAGAD